MEERKNKKLIKFFKAFLRLIKPKFSFHYVSYLILFLVISFSTIQLIKSVGAVTPNPGHPWSELGDGVFVFSNGQTTTPYTYTFPAATTTVLTTNSLVSVAQGGTGLGSIASGSVLGANSANVLSAITSATGTKVLTNTGGTITWENQISGMVYPGAGIPVSTGSAWGTSITDNSSNWNSAYTYRLTSASGTSPLTLTLLNNSLTGSISQATTSASGYLSSTDWNTFNSKQVALVSGTNIKTINSTTLLGSGDISLQTPLTAGVDYLTPTAISNAYVPYTGATGAVALGANTLSTTSGIITPKIYPASDSTTAFQINKADGTTNVLNVDTTNSRVGIGTTSPSSMLHVNGTSLFEGGSVFNNYVAIDTDPTNNPSGFEYGNGYDPTVSNYDNEKFRVNSFFESPFVSMGVAQNYLLQTEVFDNGSWVKTDIGTVSANGVVAPNGATTAENIPVGSNSSANISQQITNSTTGYWTAGVWARTQSGTATIALRIDSSAETGTEKNINLTTRWQFFSVTQNFTTAHTTKTFRIISGANAVSLWGARMSQGQTAQTYSTRTTSALTTATAGAFFNGTTIYGTLSGSASSASSAGYSNYGILLGNTLSNTSNKTDQWAYFGYVGVTYNSTYRYGHSWNIEIILRELSNDNITVPVQDLEKATIVLKGNMPTVADANVFNSTVPDFSVEISGNTKLTKDDIAARVESTSTSSKVIRFYIKLKNPNTHYSIEPQNRYGASYSSSGTNTTSYVAFSGVATQAVVASIPAPAQGSIVYATQVSGSNIWKSLNNDIYNLNSGNVGIGTNSPTNMLSLGGNSARTIWMERNTTTATAGQGLTLSSGGAIAGTADLAGGDLNLKSGISTGTGDSAIRFFTATAGTTGTTDNDPTEKMTILGNGNVGIGTTSPQSLLHIYTGSSGVTYDQIAVAQFETSSNTYINLNSPDAYASGIRFGSASDSAGAYISWGHSQNGMIIGTANTDDNMDFKTGNNAQAVRITKDGSIGIGTTNPSEKLHIENGVIRANNIVAVGSSAGHPTGIGSYIELYMFGDIARILPYDGTNYKDLAIGDWNAGNPNIMLKVGGNVGIGTGTPTQKLHVVTSSAGDIAKFRSDGGATDIVIGGNSSGDAYIKSGAGDSLRLSVNDLANPDIFIKSTGDVGIGTTNPEHLLHVAGQAVVNSIGLGGGNSFLLGADATGMILTSANAVGRGFHFKTLGTEKVTILDSGNVGIGTTSPSSKLTIFGTDNELRLSYDTLNYTEIFTTSNGYIYFQPTGGRTYFNKTDLNNAFFVYDYRNDSTTYMTFTALDLQMQDSGTVKNRLNATGDSYITGGKVGIGTTSPGELLSLGLAGTKAGVLSLAGATSGKAIIQVSAVAGTPTLTLPTSTGTLALTSDIPLASPITIVNSTSLFSTGLSGTGGNSSATDSIFLGESTGYDAINASNSIFLGKSSGSGATNALQSNFIGLGAGIDAAEAPYSNFIGSEAGSTSIYGSYSNFIGYQAGKGATYASNSIFLGTNAGLSDTVDNISYGSDYWSILIGYNTNTGGYSNSILLGGSDSSSSISNTASNQFMLADTITNVRWRGIEYGLPSSQGGASTSLINDGSGNLSWSLISGMVYPGAGIPVSTGSAWGTSITDNSSNWNSAYTYRLTSASGTSPLTLTLSNNSLTGSITQATTSTSGYLSSTDWNTFNSKQATLVSGTNIKTINSTTLLGSGDISLQTPLTAGVDYLTPTAIGTTYVPYTGATTNVVLGANTLSTTSGIIAPKIYPASDSTTAFQINKADGTTNLLNVDTTNSRIGIGTTEPTGILQVTGNSFPLFRIERASSSVGNTLSSDYVTRTNASGLINGAGVGRYFGLSNSSGTLKYTGSFGARWIDSTAETMQIFFNAANGGTNPTGGTEKMVINGTGEVGIGTTSPTAVLHLKAGTASAGTAPLKFTSGTNLTTAEAGAMEWDGTNLFITQTSGPTRKTIAYTSDIPSLSGYVPYTGATGNVNLGTNDLIFSTGKTRVAGNQWAFQYTYGGYGLYFNETDLRYDFTTSDTSPIFSIGVNSGNVSAGGTISTTSGIITPKIYPASDSTTAFQINKADGTTNVLNVDTTNSRIGIGTTTPASALTFANAIDSSVTSVAKHLDLYGGIYGIGVTSLQQNYVVSANSSHVFYSGANERLRVTSTGVRLGIIYPASDSTTAFQINKADGTTNILNVDTTNSRVGIGMTSPTAKLDVLGTTNSTYGVYSSLTSNVSGSASIYGNYVNTTTSGGYNRAAVYASALANPGADASVETFGILGMAKTNADSYNHTSLYGLRFTAQHNGTGSVSNLFGSHVYPYSSSSGTVSSAYAYYTYPWMASGTFTNFYGFYMGNESLGTGTITNKYGVYILGSTYKNYFAGNLGLGAGATSPGTQLEIGSSDLGNGVAGPVITLGRNTNSTNQGAGSINFLQKGGTAGYVWQDAAGNMRINTSAPSTANDTAGTVIGAQTSTSDTKQDIKEYTDYDDAFSMVVNAPIHTFRYIKEVNGYGNDSSLAKIRIGFIAEEVDPMFMWGNVIDQVSINGILMASIKEMNLKFTEINNFEKENSWRDNLTAWFANAENRITRIFTGEVCLTEAGEETVCLNRQELKSLKELLNQTNNNGGNTGGGGNVVVCNAPQVLVNNVCIDSAEEENATCSDGVRNQDETDIDTGGVCDTSGGATTEVEIKTSPKVSSDASSDILTDSNVITSTETTTESTN